MTELNHLIATNGGIVTLRQLRNSGVSDGERRKLLNSGHLTRLRNGWFALQNANPDFVRAVRVGGRVTCSSRLEMAGLWVMPDARLHVAVSGNASRLRAPDDRRRAWDADAYPDVRLHWVDGRLSGNRNAAADSIEASLAHLICCADRDSAVVTIDSALNARARGGRMLTPSALDRILRRLPAKYAELASLVDPEAQSGLETLARLRLRRRGLRVRTQVEISGVGRVDILIGERLVLELDSRSHHLGDNYEKDRARDLELFRQGFVVVRVSYRRVMFDWHSIEDAILTVTRRGEHMRRGMHARLGLALT
jgi:very-short-patch-repair endonuclease